MLRLIERMAGTLFRLGKITLAGNTPNGQYSILMPKRMFFIRYSKAEFKSEDLGEPIKSTENPHIGDVKLPKRPLFAVGRGYFKTIDPI